MADLTPYADAVNAALQDGVPCVLATVDEKGRPNLAFKGSMMVFDDQHLAYWERSGGHQLANLRSQSHVAVLYFNHGRAMYPRFYGEAEVHEQGPLRDQVMERVVAPELARDPERKGCAVLIRVGDISDPFSRMRAQAPQT